MTNGVISLLRGGQVEFKIVCGCRGDRAMQVAKALLARPELVTCEEIYDAVLELGLGCMDCLIVLDAQQYHAESRIGELPVLYRTTFANPWFNPRWEFGASPYVVVAARELGEPPLCASTCRVRGELGEGRKPCEPLVASEELGVLCFMLHEEDSVCSTPTRS